jgi:hypothetical protein
VTVQVLPPAWAGRAHAAGLPVHDVTTHGGPYRPLSPMLLGPVPLYAGLWSRTMENAWQYAKVYRQHACGGYWPWALAGWGSQRAERYPMGRGARPLHALWAGDELGYTAARRRIYIPLYAQAVRMYQLPLFLELQQAARAGDIVLADFDAYDHRALGYSWDDVMNDESRRMGHGMVLAAMIEGAL